MDIYVSIMSYALHDTYHAASLMYVSFIIFQSTEYDDTMRVFASDLLKNDSARLLSYLDHQETTLSHHTSS